MERCQVGKEEVVLREWRIIFCVGGIMKFLKERDHG